MQREILPSAEAVAERAAERLAGAARAAVAERGQFALAVSGGTTPWQMLRAFARRPEIPWDCVHLFQVDERVAPAGHDDRNLTHLLASLHEAPLPTENIHAMRVEAADLDAAAKAYAETLSDYAGNPPVLDLVHLGLGSDGHTASLVPDDAVLEVNDADVALTGLYQGRRRMTLTYPLLNRARQILWVATGARKAEMVKRLLAADRMIPAGRVAQQRSLLLADEAAANLISD